VEVALHVPRGSHMTRLEAEISDCLYLIICR
jgi:hypothetical protein